MALTLPRIYSSETLQNASTCLLGKDNLRYLKTVLRLRPGDRIIVFDGYGHEYEACICLLYTSDAADDLLCVDLGGRRIIKKKK